MDSMLLLAQTDEEVVEIVVALCVFAAILVISLAFQALICWLTAKCAAAIPQQFREVEPNMVWLLMIPCFGLVWNFFVFPKIASGFARYFNAMGHHANGDCGGSLALWYCLCVVFSLIPYLGSIAGIASFILLIVMLVRFWNLKGQAEQMGPGIVPTYAAPSMPMKKIDPTYAAPSMPMKKIDPTNPYA